jgi:hypothetical protein
MAKLVHGGLRFANRSGFYTGGGFQRSDHGASAREQPFFGWIGWIEVGGDKTRPAADQQGRPFELFKSHFPVHAGNNQLNIFISQDKAFIGHSLLEGWHTKDMHARPARVFTRQEAGRGLTGNQDLIRGYRHTHAASLATYCLGRAGRVVRRQDKRDGTLAQEGEEFAQAGHGLVAQVEDAVHIDDQVRDFGERCISLLIIRLLRFGVQDSDQQVRVFQGDLSRPGSAPHRAVHNAVIGASRQLHHRAELKAISVR